MDRYESIIYNLLLFYRVVAELPETGITANRPAEVPGRAAGLF